MRRVDHRPHPTVEANRRPALPPNASRNVGPASRTPPFPAAAFAYLLRPPTSIVP